MNVTNITNLFHQNNYDRIWDTFKQSMGSRVEQ